MTDEQIVDAIVKQLNTTHEFDRQCSDVDDWRIHLDGFHSKVRSIVAKRERGWKRRFTHGG